MIEAGKIKQHFWFVGDLGSLHFPPFLVAVCLFLQAICSLLMHTLSVL
jgi:hypothetical protein